MIPSTFGGPLVAGPVGSLGLTDADLDTLRGLLAVWAQKRTRNLLRNAYMAGTMPFKDLAISLPPSLRDADSSLMWPATVVTALTDLVALEGFVAAGEGEDPWGVSQVVADNRVLDEVGMAARSAAIHSCAFLTVSQGDTAAGEPGELILPRAADTSAAIWDSRRRRVREFLAVTDLTEDGAPSGLMMMTPDKSLTLTRRPSGAWEVDAVRNPLGEPTVYPLPHSPDLERPFGRSRISRGVMRYTDAAVRTTLRSELTAEVYSSPQYWILGETAGAVVGSDKWKAATARIFGISTDQYGQRPDVKRFEGASPGPHKEHLRQWAELLSSDTGVPVSSLGIVQDNPASAEAIFAQKEPLIVRAKAFTRSMSYGVAGAVRAALALRDGGVPRDYAGLLPMWSDPSHASPMGRADAHAKLSATVDGFGSTEVGLEFAGLSREQIVRLRDELRRGGGRDLQGALDKARAARAAREAQAAQAAQDGPQDAGTGPAGPDTPEAA